MTRLRNRPLGLALILLLAVTGVQLAAARGLPPAADMLVICRGLTVVTIHVDADGNETAAPHLCPDAGLTVLAATADTPASLATALVWQGVVWPLAATSMQGQGHAAPRARGPPVAI